jgi:hypothetical protein
MDSIIIDSPLSSKAGKKNKKNKKQRSRALSAARELSYTIVEMKDFSVNIPCRILLQPEILSKKVSNVTQKPLHS